MTSTENTYEAAQKAFNTINVFKGQHTSIATCDSRGNPNVAPIGTMRVVDKETVYVLQGFLPKTLSNLQSNPKAAFSVCTKPNIIKDVLLLMSKKKKIMGYRIYCEYISAEESKDAIEQEGAAIAQRAPFMLRRLFQAFLKRNITRLLKFRIIDIREVV